MSAECAAFAKLIAGRAVAGTTDWKSTVAALEKDGAVIAFEDDEGLNPFTPAAEQVERMFALAATKVKLPETAAAWFDTHQQIDLATRWVQKKIGNALSAYKAAAIQLDLRDEHHTAMTVVPWASLDKVKAAAKAAGGRVISRSPTKPLAKPLPAAKPPPSKLLRIEVRGNDLADRGTTDDGVVVVDPHTHVMSFVEATSWPPRTRKLVEFDGERIGFSRHGRWVVSGVRSNARAIARDDGTELPLPPENVEVAELGFLDGDAVIFPTSQTYWKGHASRPLVLAGKKWVPLAVPEFVIVKSKKNWSYPPYGLARTAEHDVLLWQDGGYVRQGNKLLRGFEIGTWSPQYRLTSAADGDGFFLCSNGSLVEIRRGAKPVPRLKDKVTRVMSIAPGLDGAFVVAVSRTSTKEPVFLLWWPARREYASVPAALYGLRAKDDFDRHGVSASSRLAWGYNWRKEFRALAWDSLTALPRKPE